MRIDKIIQTIRDERGFTKKRATAEEIKERGCHDGSETAFQKSIETIYNRFGIDIKSMIEGVIKERKNK